MKWLVVINDEGIQQKHRAGRDTIAAGEEEKSVEKRTKIKFIFENEGTEPKGDKFKEYLKKAFADLSEKYGADPPASKLGYNMRKRYTMGGSGLEVIAELDADTHEEFSRKYQGYKGAIEVLLNTEKVMAGYDRDNPGKTIEKLIRKLRIEAEDEG